MSALSFPLRHDNQNLTKRRVSFALALCLASSGTLLLASPQVALAQSAPVQSEQQQTQSTAKTESGTDTQQSADTTAPTKDDASGNEAQETPIPATTLNIPELTAEGVSLTWNTSGNPTKYVLHRKGAHDAKYAKYKTLNKNLRSYIDGDIQPATTYKYQLRTYYQGETKQEYVKTGTVSLQTYLATPTITSLTWESNKTSLKLSWKMTSLADSYRIEYSTDRLFRTKETLTVSGTEANATITGLKKNELYYVKIRAYRTIGSTTLHSRASESQTTTAAPKTSASLLKKKVTEKKTTWKTVKVPKQKKITKNGKTKLVTVYKTVKKGGKKKKVKVYTTKRKKVVKSTKKNILFELRSQAGQRLFGYDTVQGSTCDGTYSYFVLYNRILESQGKPSCLIAKFKESDLKLVKLSQPLDINHGNSLTYDSDRKQLIASHCKVHTVRLSCINPETLKVTSFVDVTDPIMTMTPKAQKTTLALSSLSYCAERKQFVGYDTNAKEFVTYDSSLKPLHRITPDIKTKLTSQAVLATNDYIMLCVSPKSGAEGGNQLLIYDWDGTYVSSIQVGTSYELESAFFYQGHLYVSLYAAYYPAAGRGESIQRNNYVALISGI